MMPLERRNEPLMLRQFSRMYPSYNLNPLLRRRHQQLVEAQAFFALHTHRSGRTASDSRSRLFPATQLVAMHSLKSSCRSASPKKPQKPNHNRTTGTTTETAQQPQPQQQQPNNRNPATTTTSNNKTRNESDNRQRTTTTNETGGRQQHQQQRTNTAPKRETRNPEQTPKQLHT